MELLFPELSPIIARELDNHAKIKAAPLDETLQDSRFEGPVRDGHGIVYGLLLTVIDCERVTLACAASNPKTPTAFYTGPMIYGVTQVNDIVHQLHSLGTVWDDVKPENVLIDKKEDPWVVGFGGGYTDGWAPKEPEGTRGVDLAAFDKLIAFIGYDKVLVR
ncbi:hypothetical protein PLIIFM63780_006598 [Purpureocillium lilacinum]|nr:hypothetical protein PLIIFM63780_006598 [Purpureocillium lilacinum]